LLPWHSRAWCRSGSVAPELANGTSYTVQPGDTLSGIAEAQLGDANRWPEIFELNGEVISDPNRIFPGQVLVLPA
jgi:nucleoid-associated protein YgaU